MPAVDHCHPQIERALAKDGWRISARPFVLRTPYSRLFVDFEAQRFENGATQRIIVVEAKCFPETSTQLSELYTAIGQYLVYRDHMQQMGILETLYLAVPTFAFEDVFQKFGMGVIQQSAIKLIVIDLEQEEIKAWIP